MSRWGEDPKKYVLTKASFSGRWLLSPPENGEPIYFLSFRKACEWFIWMTEKND